MHLKYTSKHHLISSWFLYQWVAHNQQSYTPLTKRLETKSTTNSQPPKITRKRKYQKKKHYRRLKQAKRKVQKSNKTNFKWFHQDLYQEVTKQASIKEIKLKFNVQSLNTSNYLTSQAHNQSFSFTESEALDIGPNLIRYLTRVIWFASKFVKIVLRFVWIELTQNLKRIKQLWLNIKLNLI